jgi:DNA-binding NarL/FixJ family response regulator
MKPGSPEADKSKSTVILADDHQVVRQGLRDVLEAESHFRVVGEAGNGLEAARLVERLRQDVLIIDLMMPGLNGLEVTRQVKKGSLKTHVIVLPIHRDESYVVEALKNGAAGYVVKDSSADELFKAIREAIAGHRYLSPPLSNSAILAYIQQGQATAVERC